MLGFTLELIGMLFVILIAAELFTNALEHLGEYFKISEGVTGSLFAAVGTALPETLIPFLALFAGTSDVHVNQEIGVGAILGAPLMLSTLSTCLMALSVLARRGLSGRIRPERTGFIRDLNFFLFAFSLAAIAMYIPQENIYLRGTLSFILVLSYFVYTLLTLRASRQLVDAGHGTEADHTLFIARIGISSNLFGILIQLLVGLSLLVLGARGFIMGVEGVAHLLGVSTLLLSLLIIPIATELPEKVNSILWIRRGKDTLAFSNITGAMVFQGTLLPAMGIMLTPWQPRIEVLSSILITGIAASWLRLQARRGGLALWVLLLNGVLYLIYLLIAF